MFTAHKHEKEIFDKAIEIESSDERAAYVRNACGDNSDLIERISALLRAHDQADFLPAQPMGEEMMLFESSLSECPGTVIGRYKLLEKIGEGGMAVVYMAEQQKPIRRKVAFKIIKLGMDTRQVIARFEAERQALAMMDHPNIAKVLDAGSTETGRPFFVMELVTGVSITEYCDKNRISVIERLKLFTLVCNAIHHAHQKSIVHRDIKPSNIMVTLHDGTPVPKVIDFGIAKAINQRLTEKTLFTRYAHIVGTPAYMSPEQAEMSDVGVDTRTDIYSLGVLLYEFLTGTTPFDTVEFHKASLSEMQRIICEHEPTKPSTKLCTLKESLTEIARYRQTNPDTLSGSVRGDLDWIVMKCLEKDRNRRYETVHGLAEDIERHVKNEPISARSPSLVYRAQKFWRRRRSHIITAAVTIVLMASLIITAVLYRRSINAQNVQWAQNVALPEIISLIEQQDYRTAFSLAKKARQYIPKDPTLTELWARVCTDYSITTAPDGADIFYREYAAMDKPWQYLGQSSLKNITLPQSMYRWKIEKEGFETHECVTDHSFDVRLREKGHSVEMVWIGAWSVPIHTDSSGQDVVVDVPAYLMDKYEVTNEQYKEFVNQGGYENRSYWNESQLIKDGRRLSWEQAMSEFVDRTGQPGPATWAEGTYPEGQGKHPVSGVSWFEANAFANFVGKSLPTVHHWENAACLDESILVVPYSHFAVGGTTPIGSHPGVCRTGLYDIAGNVKEWCWNAVDDPNGQRYILGGGYGEQTYMFTSRDFRSPWDRSPVNGFRCAEYPGGKDSVAEAIYNPVPRSIGTRDYSVAQPCSDEEYDIILRQFDYDRTPLNPIIESIDESSSFWCRREKITFNAAYSSERVIAYLYIPKVVEPPYQVVVYWPGASAPNTLSFRSLPERDFTEFVITSGRALLFPIYKGTFERQLPKKLVLDETPLAWRDWIVQLGKDLCRSVDYLETREDIDFDRMAYYGMDSGAGFGPMALAIDQRFKAAILVVGGFVDWEILEELRSIDPFNHAPRVRTPVLMINGREDCFFPLERMVRPMYETLGTSEPHKELRIYPGGHGLLTLFSRQIRDDVLGWLDRYLGPVNGTKSDMK